MISRKKLDALTSKIMKCTELMSHCKDMNEKKLKASIRAAIQSHAEMHPDYTLQLHTKTVLDIKHCGNVEYLFRKLDVKVIDISNMELSEDVDSLFGMFFDCPNLERIIGIENLDVSNVKVFDKMFQNCPKLKLPVLKWNTSNMMSAQYMFKNTKAMTKAPCEGWDTSNLTTTHHMFDGSGIKEVDLSKWNKGKLKEVCCMFERCNNLERCDFSDSNGNFNPHRFGVIFNACSNLRNCNLSGWIFDEESNRTENNHCFCGCQKLKNLIIDGWNVDFILEEFDGETIFQMFVGLGESADYCKRNGVSVEEWLRIKGGVVIMMSEDDDEDEDEVVVGDNADDDELISESINESTTSDNSLFIHSFSSENMNESPTYELTNDELSLMREIFKPNAICATNDYELTINDLRLMNELMKF